MYNIAICIPTYKRPLQLKKLILSIFDCNVNNLLINSITIIVVDNDKDRTAEEIIKEFKEGTFDASKLHYFNYDRKGLANVRNELFRRAFIYNPDFIIGIDDDEFVTTNWLNEFLAAITNTNCDIAIGPAIPFFEKKVKPYIAYWFKHPDMVDLQNVNFFQTTNYIIAVDFLEKNKIEFDEQFNTMGAEDSYFGVVAIKKGAKIIYSSKAIAYETIPENRASLNWLFKRKFRTAITYTYILLLEKKYLMVIKKILVSIIYFITGIIGLLLLPLKTKFRYWGILALAESFGGFAGVANIKFHEYK